MTQNSRKLKDRVNLYEYPPQDLIDKNRIQPNEHLTIGDLHSNALNMLQWLIIHGVFKFTPEHYKELVDIYKNGYNLTEAGRKRFYEILKNHNTVHFPQGALLRFLGDTLADRGTNDLLILILYKVLHEMGMRKKINISNHDLEFHHQWEQAKINDTITLSFTEPRTLIGNSAASLGGLEHSIAEHVTTEEEVRDLYEKYYLPDLELISYSLEAKAGKDGRPKVHLFTHAPTAISDFGLLAKLLEIDTSKVFEFNELQVKLLKSAKPEDLFKIIDAINKEVKKLIAQKKLYETMQIDSYRNELYINIKDKLARIWLRFPWSRQPETQCAWGTREEYDELPFDVENHHGHTTPTVGDSYGEGFDNYDAALGGHYLRGESTRGTLVRRSSFSDITQALASADKMEVKTVGQKNEIAAVKPETKAVNQPAVEVMTLPVNAVGQPDAVAVVLPKQTDAKTVSTIAQPDANPVTNPAKNLTQSAATPIDTSIAQANTTCVQPEAAKDSHSEPKPAVQAEVKSNTPAPSVLAQTVLATLKQRGFCQRGLESFAIESIAKAVKVWEDNKLSPNATLECEKFADMVWSYLHTSQMLKHNQYLRGLEKNNLRQLFDLYAPIKKMSLLEFCHAFFYFNRPNLDNEKGETPLYMSLDLLAPLALGVTSPLMLSDQEVKTMLKESKEDKAILHLTEGAVTNDRGQSESYGMNLKLSVHFKNTNEIQDLVLISSVPVDDKAVFLDHDRCPYHDLRFIPNAIKKFRTHVAEKMTRHLQRLGFCKKIQYREPDYRYNVELRQFDSKVVSVASNLWLENLSYSGVMTKEQFKTLIWGYLNSSGRLESSHYLRQLSEEDLSCLFDLYTLHTPTKEMNLAQFCHVFKYILRYNLPEEKNETSLSQTIKLLHKSLTPLGLTYPLCTSSDTARKTLVAKEADFVLRFQEGIIGMHGAHAATWGLNLIVSLMTQDGRFVEEPLVGAGLDQTGNPCFVFAGKELHDLSSLPHIVEELRQPVPNGRQPGTS